jgi:hypothetical protein
MTLAIDLMTSKWWDPFVEPYYNGRTAVRAVRLPEPDHEKLEREPRPVSILKQNRRVTIGQLFQGRSYEVFTDKGPATAYMWIGEHFENDTCEEFFTRNAAELAVTLQG